MEDVPEARVLCTALRGRGRGDGWACWVCFGNTVTAASLSRYTTLGQQWALCDALGVT